MSKVMTLKPGLLVSLRTSLRGGVEYRRQDLNNDNRDGAKVEEWKTTKVTSDPEEHERATKVRSKAGSLVRAVCVPSAFGYVCPEVREKQLDEAMAEAREMVAAFNSTARTCQIGVYVLKGRIAQTDDEAARAISGELREMLDGMQNAIAGGKIEEARKIAGEAKKFGAMLDEDTAKKVESAIAEVREVARDIVKKLAEGTSAAEAVQGIKLKAVETARFAFLDMDDAQPVDGPKLPTVEARGLDITDDGEVQTKLPLPMVQTDLQLDDSTDPVKAAAPADTRALDV